MLHMILCWRGEDGKLYRDRDKALKVSPSGWVEELWGDGTYDCYEPTHSPLCTGPGDVELHVMPLLRKDSITQLMANILGCCGNRINVLKSCSCCFVAMVLVEKLSGIVYGAE